jgi:hypothetical protein
MSGGYVRERAAVRQTPVALKLGRIAVAIG